MRKGYSRTTTTTLERRSMTLMIMMMKVTRICYYLFSFIIQCCWLIINYRIFFIYVCLYLNIRHHHDDDEVWSDRKWWFWVTACVSIRICVCKKLNIRLRTNRFDVFFSNLFGGKNGNKRVENHIRWWLVSVLYRFHKHDMQAYPRIQSHCSIVSLNILWILCVNCCTILLCVCSAIVNS